jgi:uncharacterized protein YecE (DUF72 family)
VKLRVGTSGFAYKEWKGSFYPDRIKAEDMLRFYGERFGTVEINNTFYRMPSASVLERWAGEVPDDFAFVLKASRRITHEKRLHDADDSVLHLLETATALGPKLGPVLYQLPPNMKKDLERLRAFLRSLPGRPAAAFEFRHPSWYDDEVLDSLRARGAALCLADTDEGEDAPPVATAPWGYLRLRRAAYGDAELATWVERVRGFGWNEAFIFFKHEEAGTGPKLAARFIELAG